MPAPVDWNEIAKIVGLLGSNHDGEVLAAVAAIRKRVPIVELVQRIAGGKIAMHHTTIIVNQHTHRQWAEGERERMKRERVDPQKIK